MPRSTTLEDYTERIARVTAHIEHHLDEECSLDSLAAIAAFSPCHFHRVFRAITGEGVAAHVRRRRLERAARRLRTTGRPVVDIAFEAGYEAHESFTRAFESAYGVAPSAWRGAPPVPPLPAVGFTIARIGPLSLVKLRHVGPYSEVGGAFGRLAQWVGARGLFGPWTTAVGLCHDDPEVTGPARLRYDAAYTVPAPVAASAGVEYCELPPQECLRTVHSGPYDQLSITYAAVIRAWLKEGARPLADSCSIEFYRNMPGAVPPEDLRTEICIPLE